MAQLTKPIECPEHIDHKAVLFLNGHKYAGIWECTLTGEQISDTCPHTSVSTDISEVWSNFSSLPKSKIIYVCDLCECEIDKKSVQTSAFMEMAQDCE